MNVNEGFRRIGAHDVSGDVEIELHPLVGAEEDGDKNKAKKSISFCSCFLASLVLVGLSLVLFVPQLPICKWTRVVGYFNLRHQDSRLDFAYQPDRIDKVDVVVSWVNGTDPERLQRKAALGLLDLKNFNFQRDRPTGQLKYALRSIERYMPWVNKVWVLSNEIPDWLDTSNPNIRVLRDEEYYLHPEHLPTFNSDSVEANVYNIPGLANHFIYLNDDWYFNRPITMETYINENNEPRVYVHHHPKPIQKFLQLLNVPFYSMGHSANLFNKRVYAMMAAEHPAQMRANSMAQTREYCATKNLQMFYLNYMCNIRKCEVSTSDMEFHKMDYHFDLRMFHGDLLTCDKLMVALNDDLPMNDWASEALSELHEFLETRFPKKSHYEL